jgi:hypothetical protein
LKCPELKYFSFSIPKVEPNEFRAAAKPVGALAPTQAPATPGSAVEVKQAMGGELEGKEKAGQKDEEKETAGKQDHDEAAEAAGKKDHDEAAEAASPAKAGAPANPLQEQQCVDKAPATSVINDYVLRVGGGDYKKALAKYIASFAVSSETSEFGTSPPCRSYRNLRVLSDFHDVEGKLRQCNSVAAITQVFDGMKVFKAAYGDLLTQARGATSRLTNAIAQAEKDEKNKTQKTQSGAGSSSGHRAKRARTEAPVVSVWEYAANEMAPVQSINMKADNSLENEFCATVPLIFRLHPDADFSKNDSSLHLAADALHNRFKKDPARIEQGRAHRAAPPDWSWA